MVHKLADMVRTHYVFPDVAEQICGNLVNHLDQGEYDDITEGELFALALTMHLQETNRDEHLWVSWHSEPLPDEADSLRHSQKWQDQRLEEARVDNFGVHKAERLPGNVGVLEVTYLHKPAWGGDTVTAAMSFLANTDALIIDLRQCTGGYPGMIALLLSYFFGDEPVHLTSIYWRDDDLTQEYWTMPEVPGKRYGEKPVYVLTSKVTFSAGEEVASILQRRKRATVIGDQTDGGAHPGASYPLTPYFEAFIPIGRAFDPVTGTDLEGVGVTPDIALPQEHAFTSAYFFALREILARPGGTRACSLGFLANEAQEALQKLEEDRKLCTACGYPNPTYNTRCKNCEELLSERP